jgi:hypothetical protein
VKDSDTALGADNEPEDMDVERVCAAMLESEVSKDKDEDTDEESTNVFSRQPKSKVYQRHDEKAAEINADILNTFIQQYIQDNNITTTYNWNKENKNLLEAATLQYRGFPSLSHIITRIQSDVNNVNDNMHDI